MYYTDSISPSEIQALLDSEGSHSVSIYLPTSALTQQNDKAIIELKNLRREAARQLEGQGASQDEISSILTPVDELLEDHGFWARLSDGLAIFSNDRISEVFRLPVRVESRASVGSRFVLKPLLPALRSGSFHILALSGNEVRFFEGTSYHVQQVEVSDLPQNLAEALVLRGREPDRLPNKQWQGDEGSKNLYRKYFRQVDRALKPIFRRSNAPLVLAGVDYLLPIYREVTSYQHVIPEVIEGNPESFSGEELHAKVLPLVERVLDAPRSNAIAELVEAVASQSGKGAIDAKAILDAAAVGKIETLLVDPSVDLMGTVTREGDFELVQSSGDNAVDLFGHVARMVMATGGAVFPCEAGELPDGSGMGALFRY